MDLFTAINHTQINVFDILPLKTGSGILEPTRSREKLRSNFQKEIIGI